MLVYRNESVKTKEEIMLAISSNLNENKFKFNTIYRPINQSFDEKDNFRNFTARIYKAMKNFGRIFAGNSNVIFENIPMTRP
jgi:sulfatase maturation enzyme AslB (radical SAM superfamily)